MIVISYITTFGRFSVRTSWAG